MSTLRIHVDGVGLYGPGLPGWAQAAPVLRADMPFELGALQLPTPDALPPAERRRVGLALKLAMAVGFDAVRQSGRQAADLASVFTSSGSDCDNCHQILLTLASEDRAVSPTRFHNSVHNMPAGYWSIATGAMAPSTSLCAHDASFVAGLIEAATQALCEGRPCLLVAFDMPYPEPLLRLRRIPHALGAALVISPTRSEATVATLDLSWTDAPASTLAPPNLEALRAQVPAARSLPLMQALAQGAAAELVLEHLAPLNLAVSVQP